MGSIGTTEIIIIFLVILAAPIALVALFTFLIRNRRGSASTQGEIVRTSELRDMITEVVSDRVTSVEAKLSEMEERLHVLEAGRPGSGRKPLLDEVIEDDEATLLRQQQTDRTRNT